MNQYRFTIIHNKFNKVKKVTSFIAVVLIASFASTACGNSSSFIEKDAKKYADLACKAQKLTKAGQGDMSVMT